MGKGRRYLGNGNPVLNGVLGGWQLYWIGYMETGHFFSPSYSGSDRSNTNTVGGLPDRLCNGNLPSDQRRIERWFDAGCFAPPPVGRLGNSGPFVLEGPGYNNQNVSIAQDLQPDGAVPFHVTASASDAFNHPNFNLPAGNISATSVGRVSSMVDGAASRQIELRGRLQF